MTPTGGWMKLNDTKLKELGIDFFKSKTEWMPQVLTSFGGTVADKDGWSGVPGLFVAGRARSVTPGVYMGGWDTCKTTTTGYIAGNSAGQYVSGLTSAPRFDDAHASRHARRHPVPARQARRLSQGRRAAHAGAHGPDGRVHPQDRQGPDPLAGTP